jgi:hypothetical protein
MSSLEGYSSTNRDPPRDRSVAHDGAAVGKGAVRGRGGLPWIGDLSRDIPTLLWLIVLAIGAGYLIVFAVDLPRNITEVSWNSGYASSFTLPETLVKTGPGIGTQMGSSGQWLSLWFGLLTATLPLHRQIWGVAPTLLFLVTALIVGWSVAQVATRRSAILAVLLCLVASPIALSFLIAGEAHNTVYPCGALLGAYLIWLTRAEQRRRATNLVVPPLVGIVVGACLASDLLVASAALVPLGLTAVLAGIRQEPRSRFIALSLLATIAVSVAIAKLTTAIMHSLHYLTFAPPVKLAAIGELPQRATLLFKGLKLLFNGYLGHDYPGTLHTELGIASDIVMSAALLALVVVGAHTIARFLGSPRRKGDALPSTELARSLHVIYWLASAAVSCGAFWLVAETGNNTNVHESYYATTIFSVAAIVPLLLTDRSWARWLIPAGVAVFFAASLAGLSDNYLNIGKGLSRYGPTITRLAALNHVTVGYGGYWKGSSLTWNTHGRVTVRPIIECGPPEDETICPFPLAAVPSWYVPHKRHTFLLVDSQEAWINKLPTGLGKPLASYTFGSIRMYVYPYDIASHLGPQPL